MATAAVLPVTSARKSSWKPIITETKSNVSINNAEFDPKRHLAFKAPSKIYTMEEIGLPKDSGISPIAVSEPFRLFSNEAVEKMRQEVLSPEVMENCQYSSNIAQCQLRGFANK